MIRTRLLRRVPDSNSAPTPPKRAFAADWAVQILVLLFGYTTLGWTYVVPTGSMETTLMTGDHLIVDHLVYSEPGAWTKRLLPYSDVKRGDIIVFRYPPDPSQNYVKRVIGVPGDRVVIRDKQVYVNGSALPEPYKRLIPERRSAYLDNFPQATPDMPLDPRAVWMLHDCVRNGELTVPEGKYFAMGDNRDNSADSRFWGLVPRENIVGKPVLVFWSYEAGTEELSSRTYLIDMVLHAFTRTRWDRVLQPVRTDAAARIQSPPAQ